MSRETSNDSVDLPPGPVNVGWVRDFVHGVLSSLNKNGSVKDNARVLLYGAQILGTLVKDASVEEQLAQLQDEIAKLKAKIGLRVA